MAGETARLGVVDLKGRLRTDLGSLDVDEVDVVCSGVDHSKLRGQSEVNVTGDDPKLTPRKPESTRLDDGTRYFRRQGRATSSWVLRRG